MRVVSCNPNWLFEGNFGIHIFFLGTAKVKKALARMFLKKVGEWTQKLKQNFNFIKFNFIFSKQQTHYKSHCEVQGYKRLQPPTLPVRSCGFAGPAREQEMVPDVMHASSPRRDTTHVSILSERSPQHWHGWARVHVAKKPLLSFLNSLKK